MAKNSVKAETMIAFLSSTITGTYQLITTLSNACFLVRIINASTEDITISYDGTTNNEYVIAGTVAQLPFQSNSQPAAMVALMAQGTPFYVKGTAGTGDIYIVGYYVPNASAS